MHALEKKRTGHSQPTSLRHPLLYSFEVERF